MGNQAFPISDKDSPHDLPPLICRRLAGWGRPNLLNASWAWSDSSPQLVVSIVASNCWLELPHQYRNPMQWTLVSVPAKVAHQLQRTGSFMVVPPGPPSDLELVHSVQVKQPDGSPLFSKRRFLQVIQAPPLVRKATVSGTQTSADLSATYVPGVANCRADSLSRAKIPFTA